VYAGCGAEPDADKLAGPAQSQASTSTAADPAVLTAPADSSLPSSSPAAAGASTSASVVGGLKPNDADWWRAAMKREYTREQIVTRLLSDDGFQGDPEIRDYVKAKAEEWLKKRPNDPATLIILAMLDVPVRGMTGPDGELLPAAVASMRLLEKAVELAPQRVDAMIQLGEMYDMRSNRKAVTMWARAARHLPDDLDIRNHLGEAYTKTGQYPEARDVALESVKIGASYGTEEQLRKAHNIVGTALTEMGEYELAEKHLKLALVNSDGSHWSCAYQALGVLYSKVGQAHDNPFDTFEGLIPEETDAVGHFSAALRYYYANRADQALSLINHAITLQRNAHFLVVKGFLVMAHQDYDGAAELFEEAATLTTNDPGPAIGRGHLAIVKQDYSQAMEQLTPALDLWLETQVAAAPDPDYYHFMHRMGCLGMGWLHANQNQHRRAVIYFDRVLAHRPSDLLARLGKGNSLMGLQLMDQAETELRGVLDLDPENPYAKAELASIHLSRGDVGKAEDGFREALAAHDQGYTCPYEGLGLVYLKQGQIDKAKENFEKAISINPDIEYKKFNGLARIYIKEGRTSEARKLLRKSIANYPYDSEARQLLEELGQ